MSETHSLLSENFEETEMTESIPSILNPLLELEPMKDDIISATATAASENQQNSKEDLPSEANLFDLPVVKSVSSLNNSENQSEANHIQSSSDLLQHPSLEQDIQMDTSCESSPNNDQPQTSDPKVHIEGTCKNVESAKDESLDSMLPCRLCSVPYQGSSLVFLFRHPPHHPEVLPKSMHGTQRDEPFDDVLSMIKATLPVKVSCCDKLPKQVCTVCIERLRLSYEFRCTVLKAECQLNSLRAQHKSNDVTEANLSHRTLSTYECPECKETSRQSDSSASLIGGSYAWESIVIKDEPEDPIEPSHEELEKSYNEFFGGHKEVQTFRTEERITLKPSKPMGLGGRRPRGRPRSRPLKVTPRGRRGRRSTQTTVERILELSGASHDNEDYGFRLRSRANNPASEALTQCLLCDRWLPGSAACLQHSLADHMDCGSFLCPRCPRDDFPGDFELIQHYQESHCPDLELYEVFQPERNNVCHVENSEQDTFNMHLEVEPQSDHVISNSSVVQEKETGTTNNSVWPVEAMDYENLNNTPPNELYESQDEVSSNLSELAPRSLTSHSALYEEESNSISTHGSDSNLVAEDILTGRMSASHVLHDKLMGEASSLVDEVSFSSSPCTLAVGDFTSDLRAMEEESQDNSKITDKSTYCSSNNTSSDNVKNGDHQGSEFKALQDDSQESQDSLRADELCGFQEAINEKSQEVSFNGSTLHFNADMVSSGGEGEPNVI